MAQTNRVDDGSFRVPFACGEPKVEFPFAAEGDLSAFVYTQKYRIDQSYFRALAPMTKFSTPLGLGYLVSAEDTTPIGNGLVEWYRVIASIPEEREVPGGQSTLNLQTLITEVASIGELPSYSAEDFAFSTPSTVTHSYSLKPIEVLRAPRLIIYNLGRSYQKIGNWGIFKAGDMILSTDTDHDLYMGFIFHRKETRCQVPLTFKQPAS